MSKTKKIYNFHLSLVKKHIDELKELGETTCNSPFLRKLITEELNIKKIKFETKIVGHGGVIRNIRKNHLKFDYKANPKLILYNLRKVRYPKSVIYENWHTNKKTNITENDYLCQNLTKGGF